MSQNQIMIIAGEVSGDQHASDLVRSIREKAPETAFFGIGGDLMRQEGVDTLYDVKDMAVMGLSEVFRRLGFFFKVFSVSLRVARERRPDAVILVDYPGFNLRFAKRANRLGLKVIYYICPQVWAWNRSRITRMARVVDRLITIFPFEVDCFKDTALPVAFVGHPLVEKSRDVLATPDILLPWQGKPRIALLPGSRVHEIDRLLPDMWDAAGELSTKHPEASFLIASPNSEMSATIRQLIDKTPGGPARWDCVAGQTRQILRQANAAIVASGTATIEAALMRCPMVVIYRVAPLTYFFGKMLVRVDNIGMVNIVAGKRICPELLQKDISGRTIANAIEPLLSDSDARAQILRELDTVIGALGDGGAAPKAAQIILDELSRNDSVGSTRNDAA